jgi:hypothetical protein
MVAPSSGPDEWQRRDLETAEDAPRLQAVGNVGQSIDIRGGSPGLGLRRVPELKGNRAKVPGLCGVGLESIGVDENDTVPANRERPCW